MKKICDTYIDLEAGVFNKNGRLLYVIKAHVSEKLKYCDERDVDLMNDFKALDKAIQKCYNGFSVFSDSVFSADGCGFSSYSGVSKRHSVKIIGLRSIAKQNTTFSMQDIMQRMCYLDITEYAKDNAIALFNK